MLGRLMRSDEERRGVRSEEWENSTVMLGHPQHAETMTTLTKKTGTSLVHFRSYTDANHVVARTDYRW
jgi:hypothetical protein